MNTSTRALWLAVIIIVSLLVGVAAGVVTWISNRNPYTGILAGGGSFGGTALLLLAMAAFLTSGS
jgi:uncharacterized membrane protein